MAETQMPLSIGGVPIVSESSLELKKHSAVSQISNRISLLQRKSYNTLLYFAREQAIESPNIEIYSIPLSRLKSISGIQIKDSKHIQESLKELMSVVVDYNLLGKDRQEEWGAFTLLSEVRIANGEIFYALPPSIKNALLNPRMYARINIAITKGLSSKHSLALYEVARDYVNVSIPRMSVKVFRNLMGVNDGQYEDFSDLRRRVIGPAVSEINAKTDLKIDVEYIKDSKDSRKVVGFQFNVQEQIVGAEGVPLDDAIKKLEDVIADIPELIDNEKFMAIVIQKLKEKGLDYVYSNIKYAISRANKNIESYTVTALENDYAIGERVKSINKRKREGSEFERKKNETRVKEDAIKEFEAEKIKYLAYYESLPNDRQTEIIKAISSGTFFGPRDIKIMSYIKDKLGIMLD